MDAAASPTFRPDRLERLADMEAWHFWFRGRRALVLGLLSDRLRAPQRIVEVGCGSGSMLAELAKRGHSVVGVDSLPEALASARRIAPAAELVQGDAAALPLESAAFDGILLLDVVEHADGVAALAEAARVLRPGGWCLVTVPALPSLWSYRDVDAGHVQRYTRRSLRRKLAGAGLAVEYLSGYQLALLPLVALTRLLGRRGPRMRDVEERPPRGINEMLARVNLFEARVAQHVPLPVGSSLVAVCRKRT